MKRSKLYLALKTLDKKEKRRFREFVFSPFFNKNEKLRNLCVILLDHLNKQNAKDLDKQAIYISVFNDREYQELRLNNLVSDLLQLLYEFYAVNNNKSRVLRHQNAICKELINRELYANFPGSQKRYLRIKEHSAYRNYGYFLDEYDYNETMDHFTISGDKRKFSTFLQEQNDHLDLYYMANKLRIACDMKSRNSVINAGYEASFIKELLGLYRENESRCNAIPALKMYFVVWQMLEDGNRDKYYYELRDMLKQFKEAFPSDELNTLYSYGLNYAVKRINSGRSEFYSEILKLYKDLLSTELLFTNGFLSQWDYTNITTSALRLSEYDWTENFIKDYRKFLLPEEEDNVYTYNLTALYFAKKDFKSALQLLHEVEYTDPFYHAAAKTIQMKVYFEMEETEAFFSLSEAFKQFVNRNKQFSDYQKKSNLNFIKATTWLFRDKQRPEASQAGGNTENSGRTIDKIQNLSPLANKAWILEKSTLKA